MIKKLTREVILSYAQLYDDEQTKREKNLEAYIKSQIKTDYLTKDVFDAILDWKSPRIGKRRETDENFIKTISSISFSANNERLKIEILCLLKGVNYRTASAILRFAFPDEYTVYDWRAWDALKFFGKIDGEIRDDCDTWQRYLSACRKLSASMGVSLEQLDRFLWMFSKENGNK